MATEYHAQISPGGEPLEPVYIHLGVNSTSHTNDINGYHRVAMEGISRTNDRDLEKEATLKRIKSTGNVSISPELFEKMYLSPQNAVKGDLRKTFGNPTPVGLLGILLSLTPLSCDLMGWRGAGQNGIATIGAYFYFGGLLLIISGLLEFLIGNTFSFVVFMSFAGFWLTFATILQPTYNAYGAYAPPGESIEAGLATEGFNASLGFFLLFMGLLCLVFLICSLRTNVVFVLVFFSLVIAFGLLTGQHFQIAIGNFEIASKLQVAGGAVLFAASMALWWIFFAIMLTSLDFPFQLPVGDLSTVIKGASSRKTTQENGNTV